MDSSFLEENRSIYSLKDINKTNLSSNSHEGLERCGRERAVPCLDVWQWGNTVKTSGGKIAAATVGRGLRV
jgi:hypothetical protein